MAVPWSVRVALAHATVQSIAEQVGADVLHIKGPALDPSISWPGRESSDADVLVRPAHLDAVLLALPRHGFMQVDHFATSSAFEHATSFRHEHLGDVDVHRLIPGVKLSPQAAFSRLWTDRGVRDIAAIACPVPSLYAQIVVLALHAARSGGSARGRADVAASWAAAEPDAQAGVLELVRELDAELAFSVIRGDLEAFRGQRDYRLWRIASSEGTRLEEWWARVQAAPSVPAALRLVARAPLVNVDHLTIELGRRPTRLEVVREFFARPLRGTVEQVRSRTRGTK